jgi:hypothetical protein
MYDLSIESNAGGTRDVELPQTGTSDLDRAAEGATIIERRALQG